MVPRPIVPRSQPVLIGIAGGSGSGKTWLARRICQLGGPSVGLISMDQYFLTENLLHPERVNFDHPSHLELDRLVQDLGRIREGKPAMLPSYDFQSMVQTAEAILLPACKVVIVEGLFVLSKPIVDLLDFTCFLEVEKDQRLIGRLLRDLHERGASGDRTIDRYQRYVRPSYEVFVKPTKHNADVVIDFTYRRAYFTELLAHMVKDIVDQDLDVEAFLLAVKGDSYRLGYSADEPVMPATVDIRDLARIYPEHVLEREPLLADKYSSRVRETSHQTEKNRKETIP